MIAGIHSILLASQVSKQIIDQLPKDPRTIVDKLDLDPRTISYLQCPACYALYLYQGMGDFIHSDNLNHHCTHRPTPESDPCGTPLWKERRIGSRTVKAPCRKYPIPRIGCLISGIPLSLGGFVTRMGPVSSPNMEMMHALRSVLARIAFTLWDPWRRNR